MRSTPSGAITIAPVGMSTVECLSRGTNGVVGRSPFPCETDEKESDGDRDRQPEVVGVRIKDGFVAAENVPSGVWRKPKGLGPDPLLQPDPLRRHLAVTIH